MRRICRTSVATLLICGYAMTCFIGSSRVLQAIARNPDKTVSVTVERSLHATPTFVGWSLRKQNITEPRVQIFFTVISFLVSASCKSKYSPSFNLHSGSSLAGPRHFFPLPRDYPTDPNFGAG